MIIIDNTAYNYIVDNDLQFGKGLCFYVPNDIIDEITLAASLKGAPFPGYIKNIFETSPFDIGAYYKHYKDCLNSETLSHFYNMTGFGDVSIVAAVGGVCEAQDQAVSLFPNDDIVVYLSDNKLTNVLTKRFSSRKNLKIFHSQELKKISK
jgi:hypothetical protein